MDIEFARPIFSILALQFNSFIQPLVILFTVPFGIIGAVAGLFVTGNPFGFMAFLGIVSLTGIIINDSIVLTDFVNGFFGVSNGKGGVKVTADRAIAASVQVYNDQTDTDAGTYGLYVEAVEWSEALQQSRP